MMAVVASDVHAEPLAQGSYWVRRATDGSGIGSRGIDNEGPFERQRMRTECAQLDVHQLSSEGGRWEYELHGQASRSNSLTFRMSFIFVEPNAALSATHISYPISYRDHLYLDGACTQPFTLEATAPAEGDTRQSNLGTIFATKADCERSPDVGEQTCRGDNCTWEHPTARPWHLPACEQTIAGLVAAGGQISGTSHEDAMRSLRRFETTTTRGGTVWQYEASKPRCDRVDVRRLPKQGGVRFHRRSGVMADGGVEEEVSIYTFEPLLQAATQISNFTTTSYAGGGGGFSSSGQHAQGGLFLTKNAMILSVGHGLKWFFWRRGDCPAAS